MCTIASFVYPFSSFVCFCCVRLLINLCDVVVHQLQMTSSSSMIHQENGAESAEKGNEVGYEDHQTADRRGKRKETESPCEKTSQAKKFKKVVVPRSDVWNHYTRTKQSRDRCICHYCQKFFSCATKLGTSNLQKHLLICREYQAHLISKGKSQTSIDDEGNLKPSKVPEKVVREVTNELLVLAELPLSFIDST